MVVIQRKRVKPSLQEARRKIPDGRITHLQAGLHLSWPPLTLCHLANSTDHGVTPDLCKWVRL